MSTILITLAASSMASSLTVTGLLRSDTNAPPAGVSLPFSLALVGGVWTGSFTDTAPPPTYTGTFTITFGGITYPPFNDTIAGGGGAVGFYTTQAIIEQVGMMDPGVWSQISNNSTGPNQARYQSAINRVETVINSRIMLQSFIAPIPMGHPQFNALVKIATDCALTELYEFPRGIRDGDTVGGQLSAMRVAALQELDELLFCNRGGFIRVAGYSDVGFAHASTTPGGMPVESCPPWPIPMWTGYRYVYGNVGLLNRGC
jgi:hypothetical protein